MKDPIVYRHSFTEKMAFPAKPDAATRQALVSAGWRYNGLHWWKNTNHTVTLRPKQVAEIIAPMTPDAPDMAESA